LFFIFAIILSIYGASAQFVDGCECSWINSRGACCNDDGSRCWKICCDTIGCGGGCCP
ncbi:unnamed protein product, partial [Brachionus calyciflorus]